MHFILVIEKISKISLSQSSPIPLFLSERDLIQGKSCRPSTSSLSPDRENLLYLKPARLIVSSIWLVFKMIYLGLRSPFLGGSPLGSFKASTASENVKDPSNVEGV